MSKAVVTFSDKLLSLIGLGFGREVADADADLALTVWAALLKVDIIVLLIDAASRADF